MHPLYPMNLRFLRTACLIAGSLLCLACSVQAQSFHAGADVTSRYLWRGVAFGNTPSLQPVATVRFGGVTAGTWGNYDLGKDAANPSEQDFFASYARPAGAGTVGVSVTDYFYPGHAFFSEQTHTMEVAATYTVSAHVPVTLFAARNVYNDAERSTYLEAAYSTGVGRFTVGAATGFVTGRSAWYAVEAEGFTLTHASLSASTPLRFSRTFAVPVRASLVHNPHRNDTWFALGFTF